MSKVIIEAAINGNAMKAHNPNIPYSPEEIGQDAIATCKAGAALIHFHVREPDGTWVQTVDYYARAIKITREQCQPLRRVEPGPVGSMGGAGAGRRASGARAGSR